MIWVASGKWEAYMGDVGFEEGGKIPKDAWEAELKGTNGRGRWMEGRRRSFGI